MTIELDHDEARLLCAVVLERAREHFRRSGARVKFQRSRVLGFFFSVIALTPI
jgi:hypothetical protein